MNEQCLCHWENGDGETVRCQLPAMHEGPHQCGQNYRSAAPLEPIRGCYQPNLAHGECPAGHGIHLDVDHYDEPMWVHCRIVDLVLCPHDMEDVTGAAMPGKHRVRP